MAEQLLSTASHQLGSLPASYVRPESQRPRLHEVISDANIPTVDLGSPDQLQDIVAQIADARRDYGFFQVVNHGVGKEYSMLQMVVAQEFFRLRAEEKAKYYSDDPAKKIRLSTSLNVRKETVRNWRDYLRLHCYSFKDFTTESPSNPSTEDDERIAVDSHPYSFIINIGDQLQAELQHPPSHAPTTELAAPPAEEEDRAVSNSSGSGEEARVSNTSNLKTIGELAVPLLACIGVYATIHADEQQQHRALYFLLLIFLALGTCASLYSIFYSLGKPTPGEGRGGGEGEEEERESVKNYWLKVAFICTLLAIILRVAQG